MTIACLVFLLLFSSFMSRRGWHQVIAVRTLHRAKDDDRAGSFNVALVCGSQVSSEPAVHPHPTMQNVMVSPSLADFFRFLTSS